MSEMLEIEGMNMLLEDFPEVKRIEYYSLINKVSDGIDLSYLKCTYEYPQAGGASGLVIPFPLTELVLKRILWSFSSELLFADIEREESRRLSPLLSCLHDSGNNFPGVELDEVFSSFGLSIFFSGKPGGALLFRYIRDDVFSEVEVIRRIILLSKEIFPLLFPEKSPIIWPEFSLCDPLRTVKTGSASGIDLGSQLNQLPLDMVGINKALGDSEVMFFKDVMPGFLMRLPEQLREMEEQLNMRDLSGLRKGNHRIKGASASLFALSLSCVSIRLEEAIDSEKIEDIQAAFLKLKEEIDCLVGFFRTVSAGLEGGSDAV
ncbi:MAG: Hpt domain-containing protein [Spirochaetales bacterium]|nr:Hpt domain-containing protein [Spirochaetales bacterium]